jgi:hypothetical protein
MMETLAKEFKHGGRAFRQLKRDGRVALYALSGAGYEVVVVQRQAAREIHGYSFPECEVMPTTSQWGRYGWSYLASDLAGAERRYDGLQAVWGWARAARKEGGLALSF